MHPAYSVILFTTASGAGYGLLALLAVFGAAGVLPANTWLGFVGIGLGLALVVAGLLSSTFHLGRPERAARAFTQWRSSWLAREGVAAIAAFAPIASEVIYCSAGRPYPNDPAQTPYRKVRRDIWPITADPFGDPKRGEE